jgi:uncharacterized protein YyaL (SSP411 family)
MLYDNSQLARVYLHAWLLTSEPSQAVTGNGFFRTITEEILDCIACEMLNQPKGFTAPRTPMLVGSDARLPS